MKRNLRKLLLTRVYNGPSTTIFCVTSVTRRLLDTTTRATMMIKDSLLLSAPIVKGVLQRTFFISTNDLCRRFSKIVIILFLSKAVFIKRTFLFQYFVLKIEPP